MTGNEYPSIDMLQKYHTIIRDKYLTSKNTLKTLLLLSHKESTHWRQQYLSCNSARHKMTPNSTFKSNLKINKP
jgi:hypothetical protein